MKCHYCGFTPTSSEMYVMQKAVKPKATPNRWKRIGHCCEACFDSGKPCVFEFEAGNKQEVVI